MKRITITFIKEHLNGEEYWVAHHIPKELEPILTRMPFNHVGIGRTMRKARLDLLDNIKNEEKNGF